MLLKQADLEAVRSGDLSVVFRRWRRPTVKTGGTLNTPVGVLAIRRVTRISRSDISPRDALAAGCQSLPDLLAKLDARDGDLYRIDVRFAGADPRLRLREDDDLTQAELAQISRRLARLDAASRVGDWTHKVLHAIQRHPHMAAADLARHTGFTKDWLKLNIRKLKNLGLTISHQPGYELSPRGKAVLRHRQRHGRPAAATTRDA